MEKDRFKVENTYLELRPDTPVVEICDNKRVVIENHRGICCYGMSEIVIKVKKGGITVCGDSLYLSRMNKTKLVICGNIMSVHIQKENESE